MSSVLGLNLPTCGTPAAWNRNFNERIRYNEKSEPSYAASTGHWSHMQQVTRARVSRQYSCRSLIGCDLVTAELRFSVF